MRIETWRYSSTHSRIEVDGQFYASAALFGEGILLKWEQIKEVGIKFLRISRLFV
jgi:hypothetical protein